MSDIEGKEYSGFISEIKDRVYKAQYEALKKVNKELIQLYWDIGRGIAERQEKHNWGKAIVETLSEELQKEFPGVQGFSVANLWRMRKFYDIYRDNEKLAPLVREIGWSHNVVVMEKCKEEQEREFYIRMTKKYGWTKNVLTNQIEGKAYESYLVNQTNFDKALEEKYRHQAKLAVKDNYTFDFLEVAEELAKESWN